MRPGPGAALFAAAAVLGTALPAAADERKFTYSYEAKTLPQGTWEAEQWATLQEGKSSGRWSTLLLREEIEYGLTDRLNASVYLNSTLQANSAVPGVPDEHSFGFQSFSTEWKAKLTEPAIDPVGFLLYEELLFSNTQYEIETKLVFSREIGPWTFAYNFVWEAQLNRSADPAASPQWSWEHEFTHSLGASLGLAPSVALGVEALDVSRFQRSLGGPRTRAQYVGPNLHVQGGAWWATLTLLRQASAGRGPEYTDPDNTKYAFRLIVGVNF